MPSRTGKSKTKLIGRYPIRKKIGQGSMGSVYLGYDEMIDRKVAIKAIRFHKNRSPSDRQKTMDLFFEEAKIIGKLSHPHITAIYDMGIHGYAPFLVMEYVAGINLEVLMKQRETLSLDDTLGLMVMICNAIHYVHRHGILHRDLKPSNIMVNMENRTPKIMDFGIAKPTKNKAGKVEDFQVENQTLWGTPYYMSPEQILGKEMSPRSDVFSLGILFYEWLSGERPFEGKDTMEVLTNIVRRREQPLHKSTPMDKDLAAIVHRAMEKKMEKRFSSASALSDALEIYREKKGRRKTWESPGTDLDFTLENRGTVDRLREQYPFFFEFTDDEIIEIFQISNPEIYEKGEVVISEGQSGKRMYFIIDGSARVKKEVNGKSVTLKTLRTGDCFGEMAIIDNMPRIASVVALERTNVIALNEAVLRHSNPQLCLKLFRSLAMTISEKLRITDKKYMHLVDGLAKLSREADTIFD